MTMTKKLKNHASAQCCVNVSENEIELISYTTRVITAKNVDKGERIVECTGTYSPTTAKQISWFLSEYLPDLCLADMKKIIGKGEVRI